jgi:hypothetical protein
VAQARLLLQELMTLKGSGAASQAAEIILSHLGCGDVRCVQVAYSPLQHQIFCWQHHSISLSLLHLPHPATLVYLNYLPAHLPVCF